MQRSVNRWLVQYNARYRIVRRRRTQVGVLLVVLLLSFSNISCDYDRFNAPNQKPNSVPVTTMDIAALRTFYQDDPVWVVGQRSVVVSGYVTTSDQAGNFYRSFFIEDETGAVEIRAGLYDLYATYRLGQQVTVVADSLTLGMTNGVWQLGLGSAAYETDYMNHRVVVDKHLFRGERFEEVIPRPVKAGQLNEEWLGTLVRFDGVHLDGGVDTTWALPASLSASGVPQSAYLKFRDEKSDSIYVVTSGYASFAGETVPTEAVSVTGILMQGKVNGKLVYQLKMRDLNDVED